MPKALEGSKLCHSLSLQEKPLKTLKGFYAFLSSWNQHPKSILLCRVEEKHTKPRIIIGPSRIMGGKDTNSSCSEFPKVTHENMLYIIFNNVQKMDWQKIDGNGNLAYNEIFHYHNNPPEFTRKIKYEKHKRKKEFTKYKLVQMLCWLYTLRMFPTPHLFQITSY